MKTYEELLEAGYSDGLRGKFCDDAVRELEATEEYRDAMVANQYYNKHNVTIETYVKWLYTVTGRKIKDDYSANYRLQTHHFRRKVIQHVNYLSGKGVQLTKPEEKQKLGKDIDHQIQKAIKMAMVDGKAFGFWNNDHLEVFGLCCTQGHAGFCPIYSEDTAEMMAGIRFRRKKVGRKTITLYTLYEVSGITEYSKNGNEDVKLVATKPYKTKTVATAAEGVIRNEEEGYGELPIIPMYANDTYESDFVGLREAIDCYDLIKSGLANNIDDASEIFWLVKNAGGMTDPDLAKFIQRLRRTKAAGVDSESGGDVVPHTVDVPYEARKAMLEIVRTDLYDDMMLLDRRSLSAAQKTNQELEMAYQPQDDYINDLEFYVLEFMDKVLALAGIDAEAIFERNRITNAKETVDMILSAANYLSPECIISHMPFLTPEQQQEEIDRFQDEQIQRFNNMQGGVENGESDQDTDTD